MQISYDSEGRILAVSPIDGVLSGENILSIPDSSVPQDLFESLALGAYVVRKGKLEKGKDPHERPADPAADPATIFSGLDQSKRKRK